jgi:prevent-host-death family protein
MTKPRTVGSRDLKTRLGAYLRLVRQGVVFVVTDRGHPVARLEPIVAAAGEAGRLAKLAATGQLSRETSEPLPPFRAARVRSAPLSATIVKERRDRF